MADALVLGASTFCVWVQVPSSAPIKSTPAGVLLIGAEDGWERIPFCKGAVCALIEREGRTLRWSSLHTSLPLRGGRLVRFGPGAFFFGAGGTHTFCRFKSICPDGTRKTTLTVFFHTIFPSGGEGFFVEAGRLFYWCKGERMDFYKGRGTALI